MIRIRRIEPHELSRLKSRMDQVVNSLRHGLGQAAVASGFLPRADIHENAAGILITLDLAGVTRDDIDILIEGPFLRVGGVRREPTGGECLRWHQMEITYGPFERVFSLPQDADIEKIAAIHRDGFLQITIPKRTPERRQVPVEVP